MDPWELSRKGKLGGSEVFFGGPHSPTFLKFQESWSKGGHAAREMATIYFILLLLVVGQIFKNPLPPLAESVSAHLS